MNQINYDRQMQAQIESLPSGSRPTLLLYSCCGPCSSAVLERLAPHFDITVFFYNPNILPAEEYQHRLREQRRLLRQMVLPRPIVLWEGPYEPDAFFHQAHGLENEPEGGRRCTACFSLRLQRTTADAPFPFASLACGCALFMIKCLSGSAAALPFYSLSGVPVRYAFLLRFLKRRGNSYGLCQDPIGRG